MNITSEKKYYERGELGVNILEGITPEIKRLDGKDEEIIIGITSPETIPGALNLLTNDRFDYHLDIWAPTLSLVYDLRKPTDIEQINMLCHKKPYEIREFEVYASNDKNDLFNKENRIIYCDNSNCDQFADCEKNVKSETPQGGMEDSHLYSGIKYDIEGVCCRYLGFVQLSTHDKLQGCSRIASLGAYSKGYTASHKYINENYAESCIANTIPEIKGEYSGNAEALTDGVAFGGDTFIANNTELKFNLPYCKKVDKLVIIGKDLGDVYYADDNSELKKVQYTKTDCNVCDEYIVDVSEFGATNTATLKLSGNIDQIVMCCYSLDVKVDFDDVINNDFLGIGGNYLPTHLFEMSRMQGFNDAYMQLERRRIAISKPSIVRLWFQLDWFVMDEADYYNRKYVFNTPKMQAVYKDLDALRDAGVEIEISYAWHTNYPAHDWYSFEEAFNKKSGAPRDTKQCAISCVDLLKELIINRGYTNIKYLSFCNESNNGLPDGWDFVCPEGLHPMDHWLQLLRDAHATLKEEGMDKYVDIWAAEVVGEWEQWAKFFNEKAPELYTLFTGHYYYINYNNGVKVARDLVKAAGNRPVGMTEFATYHYRKSSRYDNFIRNNNANALGFINGGATTMLHWILSGSLVDEWYTLNHENGNFWKMGTFDCPEPIASENYYGMSLLTNYIKRHSTVYRTNTDDYGVHPVVVESRDGDITVIAEAMITDLEKTLNVDFGKHIGKKFYKHVYTRDIEREANLIIPPVVAEIDVDDKISDTLPADYVMVVYTTIPPVKQVVLDKVFATVDHGEEVKLNASIIDGDGTEGEIKWSIADYNHIYGLKAEVTQDGVFKSVGYHAPKRYWRGRPQFAVKAELPTGEYGIAIVTIEREEGTPTRTP